jgi:hypothetical protein
MCAFRMTKIIIVIGRKIVGKFGKLINCQVVLQTRVIGAHIITPLRYKSVKVCSRCNTNQQNESVDMGHIT